MNKNNSLAMFDTLQDVANTGRQGHIVMSSNDKVESVRLGTVTNAPQVFGTPRPGDKATVDKLIQKMETAEQRQIDKEKFDSWLDRSFKPEDDQLLAGLKEFESPLDKETYDDNKTKYQEPKDQASAIGLRTKSLVDGFDDYDDDTKTLY